jgi:hypothetical protein
VSGIRFEGSTPKKDSVLRTKSVLKYFFSFVL